MRTSTFTSSPRYVARRSFAGLEFDDPDYGNHYGIDWRQFVTVDFASQLRSALTD
jgi:hypothetical protein